MTITIAGRIYFLVEDIAKETGMHVRTVRELLKSGKLKGKKQGKRWYVSERNLQAFFDSEPQSDE